MGGQRVLQEILENTEDICQYVHDVLAGQECDAACRDKEKKMQRKPSEKFFEAPEALPARGSIPSVQALDPAVAAARQALADEAEHANLIHAGEPTSSPPVPAEVVWHICSLRPHPFLLGTLQPHNVPVEYR